MKMKKKVFKKFKWVGCIDDYRELVFFLNGSMSLIQQELSIKFFCFINGYIGNIKKENEPISFFPYYNPLQFFPVNKFRKVPEIFIFIRRNFSCENVD